MDESLRLYLKDIQQMDLLSPTQERVLAEEAMKGNREAYNELVNANLRLVVSIAKKYCINRPDAMMDLIQQGNLGLMKAIEKFDPAMGNRLSTYATPWIKQYIRQYIESDTNLRLPFNVQLEIRAMKKAERKLTDLLGREPLMVEIANEMGTTISHVNELKSYAVCSLDAMVGEDEDTDVGSFIADDKFESPEASMIHSDLGRDIYKVLGTLHDRERELIIRRYGLETGVGESIEQLAETFSVTPERIRQMEAKVLRKLRNPARSKSLQGYL